MDLTLLLTRMIGPVLLLRGLSILIGRDHFRLTVAGLENEVTTISFSMFPIGLLMACIAIVVTPIDTSNLAGILLRIIAWGGIVKGSLLILFPAAVVRKAKLLEHAGFLNLVVGVCFLAGGYFTWFGYFAG